MADRLRVLKVDDVENTMVMQLARTLGNAIYMNSPNPAAHGFRSISDMGHWRFSGENGGTAQLAIEMSDTHKRDIAQWLRNLISLSPGYRRAKWKKAELPKPMEIIDDNLCVSMKTLAKLAAANITVANYDEVGKVMGRAFRFEKWHKASKPAPVTMLPG
jgi:hypothetical protein